MFVQQFFSHILKPSVFAKKALNIRKNNLPQALDACEGSPARSSPEAEKMV